MTARVIGETILSVQQLAKTFRRPFTRKRVEAVRGISFEVKRGEIFGFLGPNGAGKTTTIKMLTGLIAPTSGSATLFGHAIPSPEAMGQVGFLPENPYVYPYLTPREFVSMCGRLNGMKGAELFARVETVIAKTGMAHAIDRPVRALSKGMLQRVGLAAALVHSPSLLLLDEPMSGLDPVGRKEVRDLILEERDHGRTIFFSSHILSDVEMLCDRVCILRQGNVVVAGSIRDLLRQGEQRSEITVVDETGTLRKELERAGVPVQGIGHTLVLEAKGDDGGVRDLVSRALAAGAHLESVTPKRETLEEIFVRDAVMGPPPTLENSA